MSFHSKTGLLPANKKITIKYEQRPHVHLKAIAVPAPYTLKPFAGLYNPFPHGCSLLCNHPADNETKKLVKKAKDTWAIDGKPLLLAEEVAAIRATLKQLQAFSENEPPNVHEVAYDVESVPEELFRRYTETDSRPLTPAPTVISNYTRTSAVTRRCVTPDPMPASAAKEKTQLILDLRRSHSQETLSWFAGASSNLSDQPIMRIQRVPTIPSQESTSSAIQNETPRATKIVPQPPLKGHKAKAPENPRLKPEVRHLPKHFTKHEGKSEIVPPKIVLGDNERKEEAEATDDDESMMKRRGKKRHKKGRDSSIGPLPVQASVDPETQIATIGINSHNPSARPSLASNVEVQDVAVSKGDETNKNLLISYLDANILKQLRRELTDEVIDNEFNIKRRKALEETMRMFKKNKPKCEELRTLQKELTVPTVDVDFWLSLPRMFSRSSARFELPVDSRMFSTMTPIDYVRDHVTVSSPRRLLYNYVFNRHKIQFEIEEDLPRQMLGKTLRTALNEMMGKPLSEKQFDEFHSLVGWEEDNIFDFKGFCGICALCERLLAPQYYPLSKEQDPCQEIERVDFESLERRLDGQTPDPRLLKVMYRVRDS